MPIGTKRAANRMECKKGSSVGRIVKDLMEVDFVRLQPEQTLYNARQIMRKNSTPRLPVVVERFEELVGFLSEGDIDQYCQEYGMQLNISNKYRVSDVMKNEIVYCYPSDELTSVVSTMTRVNIDSVAVLNNDTKKILGIITAKSVL